MGRIAWAPLRSFLRVGECLVDCGGGAWGKVLEQNGPMLLQQRTLAHRSNWSHDAQKLWPAPAQLSQKGLVKAGRRAADAWELVSYN